MTRAILSFLESSAGAVGKKTAAATIAATIALGVPLAAKWEGKENKAYWDAYGRVYTVCYGETKGVKKGDTYSDAECLAMLEKSWAGYYSDMRVAFPNLITAPPSVQAAAVDLAYNVGTGAVISSKNTGSALRQGNWERFCNLLPQWNKSGGVFLRGLLNRRNDAKELCLSGL